MAVPAYSNATKRFMATRSLAKDTELIHLLVYNIHLCLFAHSTLGGKYENGSPKMRRHRNI